MSCDKCGGPVHRDDYMNRRCDGCERLVHLCDCKRPGTSLPTHAILPGKGKVLILEYVGKDMFRVLTNRDEVVRVNRARLIFIKEELN